MIHVWIPWIICFFLRRLQWMKKESGDLRENTREAEGEAHTRLLWFGRYVLLTGKNLILSGSVGGQGWFLYSCEGFRLWESVSALFPKFFQKVAIHSWLINILIPLPFRGHIRRLADPMRHPIQFQIICCVPYVNRTTYPPLLPVHRPPLVQFFWLFTHKLLSFVRLIYLIPSKTHGEISVIPFFEVSYDIMANINKCDEYSSTSFSYHLLYNIECNRQPSHYPRRHHGPCSSRKRTAERGWVWWQRKNFASLS